MTIDEYFDLLVLINEYGDACEDYGNFSRNEDKCDEAMQKIQDFLMKFVKNT